LNESCAWRLGMSKWHFCGFSDSWVSTALPSGGAPELCANWRKISITKNPTMSLALCASAPSHPLHAMPPWITRNSDRLRASDRTMVDTQNQFSLAKFQDSIGVVTTRSMKPLGKEQTSQIKTSSASRSTSQWAGSRDKNLLVFRSREKFFLDIPFYRTH
jgi:hypothetical protein